MLVDRGSSGTLLVSERPLLGHRCLRPFGREKTEDNSQSEEQVTILGEFLLRRFCFQGLLLPFLFSQVGRHSGEKRLDICSNVRNRRKWTLARSFVSGKHLNKVVILCF